MKGTAASEVPPQQQSQQPPPPQQESALTQIAATLASMQQNMAVLQTQADASRSQLQAVHQQQEAMSKHVQYVEQMASRRASYVNPTSSPRSCMESPGTPDSATSFAPTRRAGGNARTRSPTPVRRAPEDPRQRTLHQMAGCQGVPATKHSSNSSAPIGPLATAIPVPSSHPEAIRPPETSQAPTAESVPVEAAMTA